MLLSRPTKRRLISYELGWRHIDEQAYRSFELVGFFTDFDNSACSSHGNRRLVIQPMVVPPKFTALRPC